MSANAEIPEVIFAYDTRTGEYYYSVEEIKNGFRVQTKDGKRKVVEENAIEWLLSPEDFEALICRTYGSVA